MQYHALISVVLVSVWIESVRDLLGEFKNAWFNFLSSASHLTKIVANAMADASNVKTNVHKSDATNNFQKNYQINVKNFSINSRGIRIVEWSNIWFLLKMSIFSSMKTSLISTGTCFGTFIGPKLMVVSGLFEFEALLVLQLWSFHG